MYEEYIEQLMYENTFSITTLVLQLYEYMKNTSMEQLYKYIISTHTGGKTVKSAKIIIESKHRKM